MTQGTVVRAVAARCAAGARSLADVLARLPDLNNHHVVLAASAALPRSSIYALYDAVSAQNPASVTGAVVSAVGFPVCGQDGQEETTLNHGFVVSVFDRKHWDAVQFIASKPAPELQTRVKDKAVGRWPEYRTSQPKDAGDGPGMASEPTEKKKRSNNNSTHDTHDHHHHHNCQHDHNHHEKKSSLDGKTPSLKDIRSVSRSARAVREKIHVIPNNINNVNDEEGSFNSKVELTPDPVEFMRSLRTKGYNSLFTFTDKENTDYLEFVDTHYIETRDSHHNHHHHHSDKNESVESPKVFGLIGAETPFTTNTPFCLFTSAGMLPYGSVGLALRRKRNGTHVKPKHLSNEESKSPMYYNHSKIIHARLETLGPTFSITKCTGNVIKQISGKTASSKLLGLTQKLSPVKGVAVDDQLYARIFVTPNEKEPVKQAHFVTAHGETLDGAVYKVSTGDISKGMLALGGLITDLEVGMNIQFLRHIGLPEKPSVVDSVTDKGIHDNADLQHVPLKLVAWNKDMLIPGLETGSKSSTDDVSVLESEIVIASDLGVFLNDGSVRTVLTDGQRPNDPTTGSILVNAPYSLVKI